MPPSDLIESRRLSEPAKLVERQPRVTSGKHRVLMASHSHPQFSKGGAEIAAYHLFSALQERPGYESWFLGCLRDQINQKLGATISQPFTEREYIYSVGHFDWFKFSNGDPNFPREFKALLANLQPDLVHFHHYANFGLEAFLHVRSMLPEAKIVLTIHEYQAICNHFGQMVTREHKTLCYGASPLRCSECFNEITPSDFFLRNLFIRRFFDMVDHFISPSAFLAERYTAWGVPSEKITVIENLIPTTTLTRPPYEPAEGGPLRVGFFGQISFLKGIHILLEAAAILEEEGENNIVFEIFGDHRNQPPEFQKDFLDRMAKVGRNVKLQGPYDQNRVNQLMQSVDAILIPSIWWENSPVVIQEAFRNRRPIICSDIGGMAEKVRPGVDGFQFPVGNAVALASLLRRCLAQPQMLIEVARTIQAPATAESVVQKHERLYETLLP